MLSPSLSHNTSNHSATLLWSKKEVRSVTTFMNDSYPIIDQGPIFEGVLGPPASNPKTRIHNISVILKIKNSDIPITKQQVNQQIIPLFTFEH